MKHSFSASGHSHLRAFAACLLAFAILLMPFAPVAAATRGNQRSELVDQRSKGRGKPTAKNAETDNLFGLATRPQPSNGTRTPASADVSLDKTLTTSGPFTPGQSLTYTLVVANAGPSTATNIQVTDTPTNLNITNVSGGGCAALPCAIASLASGSNVTITVTATITAAGAFDNSATATASESDPSPSNNTDNTGNGGTTSCPLNPVVTSNADSGPGTLREAVANVCPAGTINFDPALTASAPATITLTSGELVIDKSVTITGPTNHGLTISGNNASRVFNVNAGMNFTMSNLTIANGQSTFGGGLYNLGNLTISNSTFTGNNAVSFPGEGGAIDTEGGTVKIFNITISGNQAASGGGLLNCGTSQTTLTNVTVANNNASGFGGGIYQISSDPLLLNNTIVAPNTSDGSRGEDDIF